MLTIIASASAKHQMDHQWALYLGLKEHKIDATLSNSISHAKTDIVACWGWRIGKKLKEQGHRVLVMERGYLGDRFKYTSLAFDGLNGHAIFPVLKTDRSRFDELGISLKPWKSGGDYALIMGQVPHDASLQGRDMVPWYADMAREIKAHYNIPVLFRPHPDAVKKTMVQNIPGTERSHGDLSNALDKAMFTVCFNSNSSVDSVINGVPCFVGDRGSMAYDMCSHDIDKIIYPEREDWVYDLAWKQWRIDEISNGSALKGIVDML